MNDRGSGSGGGALARAHWLAQATGLLEGLLNASEPHQLEAFHAYRIKRDDVSVGDLAAARQLLLHIVGALDGSRPEAWPQLSMALDATLPDEPPVPSPLRGEVPVGTGAREHTIAGEVADTPASKTAHEGGSPVDSTMPAMAPPIRDVTGSMKVQVADARPATDPPPPSGSIDETVALGELQALDLDAAAPPPAAGGTTPMTNTPSTILDIDKYAVLCAWTELQPDRRDELHHQYGLDSEADRKALDDHFEQLFRHDASLRAAFAQRLRMHMKFLRAGQAKN